MDENANVHTKELHLKNLHELCRTCGRKSLSRKDKKNNKCYILCEPLKDGIKDGFDVDINGDDRLKHSTTICYSCRAQIKNFAIRKTDTAKAKKNALSLQHIWVPFQDGVSIHDCRLCVHYYETTKGVINKKKLPTAASMDSILKGKLVNKH